MKAVVLRGGALHLRKSMEENHVCTHKKSHLWENGWVDVNGDVHLGEVFQSFSQEKFHIL